MSSSTHSSTSPLTNVNNQSIVCFWDKHTFDGEGVMCPIAYKPKQIVHKKREYYINQNTKNNTEIPSTVQKILEEEILYMDKFCSNSCLLAWIEDNQNNPVYKQSMFILANKLLCKLPIPANHWKTLKSFGGFLDIDTFRTTNSVYELKDISYENGQLVETFKENISIL